MNQLLPSLWMRGITSSRRGFEASSCPVGVVTTASAALIAHVEAGRYDFIAASYRATAKRLENAQALHNPATPLPDFVEACEAILSAENSAWMAKFLKQ